MDELYTGDRLKDLLYETEKFKASWEPMWRQSAIFKDLLFWKHGNQEEFGDMYPVSYARKDEMRGLGFQPIWESDLPSYYYVLESKPPRKGK